MKDIFKFIRGLVWVCLLLVSWGNSLAVTELQDEYKPIMVKASPSDKTNKRIWNLHNVDLLAVINEVAKETGKNFLVDPKVKGNVTLVSGHEMRADEVYQVFLSVLAVSGYAAVDTGDVTKIVPVDISKQMGTPIATASNPGQGDEVVVRVIPVQHVAVADLSSMLRGLVDPQGQLVPYIPSNVIIIADRAANVQRIAEIIHRVDVSSTDGLEMISLKNANSADVEQVLMKLVNSPGQSFYSRPTVAADDRSNSILISGNKTQRLRLRAMIAQLDVPVPGVGATEVIFIHYQRAGDLVPSLASVQSAYYATKKVGKEGGVRTPGAVGAGPATGGTAASEAVGGNASQTTSVSGGGYSGFNASNVGLGPLFSDDFFASRGQTVANVPGITVEANTNALVITAPTDLMRMLKTVIRKLDLRRPQVLVEAVIAEVQADRDLQFGIEWRTPVLNNELYTGTNFADVTPGFLPPVPGNLPSLQGLAMGIIRHGDLRAVLRALATDVDSNILSTPSIVTLDNEKAIILVQERIPVVTGDYQQPNTPTSQPYRTFAYAPTGIKLTILPQITQDEAVQLKIQEQTGDVIPGSASAATDGNPTFRDRGVETSVLVNDGDVLVLGGLIQNTEVDTVSKIPILGDLPVIGHAFQNRNRANTKLNLMAFIRPIILRNRCDNFEVTKNQYDFIRDHELLREFEKYGHVRAEANLPSPPWSKKKLQSVCTTLPSPFGLSGNCCRENTMRNYSVTGGCCGR